MAKARLLGGQVSSRRAAAAVCGLSLFCAVAARAEVPPADVQREPSLAEAQEAAARLAGGDAADDRSRASRARRAHWAPVVRGLVGGREDQRTRRGEFRLAPLREDDTGSALTWGATVTWDLSQLIFAREETQLVHAQVKAAHVRQQAAAEAARLYVERRARQLELRTRPLDAGTRARLSLEVLRLTALLDSLTGGLFRSALDAEEAAVAPVPAASAAHPAPAPSLPKPTKDLSPPEKR